MAGVVPWQALCLLVFLLGATATSAAPKYQDDVSDQELISILARFLGDETKKTDQADKKVDGAEHEIEGAEKKRADIEEKIGFENNIESVEKKIAKDDKKVEGVEEEEKSLSDYSDKELYSMLENILSDENEGTGNKITKDEKKIAEDEKKIAKAEKKYRSDDSDGELVNLLAKILGEENHKTDKAETEAIQTAQNSRIRAFDGAAGCSGSPLELEGSNGVVTSLRYPEKYPNFAQCVYQIRSEPWETVQLVFDDFEVEASNTCSYDYVEVTHGANDQLIGRYCGSSAPAPITSDSSDSSLITIRFYSDSSVRKRGFQITWTVTAEKFPGCGDHPKVIAPSDAGSLQSPAYSYGTTYPANLFCSYLILGPPGKTITLSFPQFNVEGLLFGLTCPFDWLKVYDGNGASDFQLLKACGNSAPDQITSSTDAIFIEFRTDSTKQKAGWVIDYAFNQVSPPAPGDPCDATAELLEGDNLEIFSPNFGLGDYPLNATCVWHVQAASGNQIRVHFVAMSIEGHSSCGWDYLLIGAGHKQAGDEDFQNKLCGEIGDPPREDIVLSGTEATFVFHSDLSQQDAGFHLVVTSETATDGGSEGGSDGGSDGGQSTTTISPSSTTTAQSTTSTAQSTTTTAQSTTSTAQSTTTTSPISGPDGCDFESGFCDWTNDNTDDLEFVRRKASDFHGYKQWLPSKDVSEDNENGHYIMSETTSATKGQRAVLVSGPMPATQGSGRCLRFAYFKEGPNQGTVNLKIRLDSGAEDVIWSRSGDQGLRWYSAMATIQTTRNHRLVFEVITSDVGYDNFLLLDDFRFEEQQCVPTPHECGQRGGNTKRTVKKIMNGQQSSTAEWPFVVKLSIRDGQNTYQCGGSLIDRQWVLSAAHCFEYGGAIAKDVTVYLGETSLLVISENNFKVKAEDIFIHPDRTSVGVAPNDIALVKLPYPVHLTETTSTVCLPDVTDFFQPGDTCTTIGWGVSETGQVTTELYHFDALLITDGACQAGWSTSKTITTDMLCTEVEFPEQLQSSCSGDSGGPLTCEKNGKYYLAGVVSWGHICQDVSNPTHLRPEVFAEVVGFKSWIEQTIASETDHPIS